MTISVHTNKAALTALQNLNKTNDELGDVQNRINTGLKIANAKDNAAVWAIAQGQRADIGALGAVKMSLERANSIAEVSLTAGETISDLLVQLDVIPAADLIQLPPRAETVKVLKGGPVETGRGFVLHSADFFIENSTLPIDDGICLTATLDILKAIARGDGPVSAVLALGYAGWAPGQLETEIQANGWLHCAADPELIFGQDNDTKYERAMRKIGIDLGMLSSEAGHA